MAIKIITDSTSYIPKNLINELQIAIASLSVIIDGKSYLETDLNLDDFYGNLSKLTNLPTSSQPSVESLITLFKDAVKEGHEVVGIFLSSLMSGAYSTAQLAKNLVLEEFPQAKIEIVDSRTNCMEMGFVVLAAARAAIAGKPMEEVLQSAHQTMKCTRFIFAPYTLEFLKKGGRIGNASSLLADILKIKPVLTVVDGVTTTLSKIRTHKKALEYIMGVFEQDVKTYGLSDAMVHHIYCLEQGIEYAKSLAHITNIPIQVITIGAVIGTHVGPGTIGIAYCTKEPMRP